MLTFMTDGSAQLLKDFKEAIASGEITTWSHEGGYYGHLANRWIHKAYFQAKSSSDRLTFSWTIVETNVSADEQRSVYAYYHGHLAETFMNHFYYGYTNAVASSQPTEGESSIK